MLVFLSSNRTRTDEKSIAEAAGGGHSKPGKFFPRSIFWKRGNASIDIMPEILLWPLSFIEACAAHPYRFLLAFSHPIPYDICAYRSTGGITRATVWRAPCMPITREYSSFLES